jgi:hypothetical protein
MHVAMFRCFTFSCRYAFLSSHEKDHGRRRKSGFGGLSEYSIAIEDGMYF